MMQSKVIDADGHILEPPDLWARYLENRYKDECIKKSGSRGQRNSFLYLKIWIPTAEGGS
jgi:hypothetical protein